MPDPKTIHDSADAHILLLNLTKTMDPAPDYVLLGEQLKTVDERFKSASPQHDARRWEYAMCLRVLHEWRRNSQAATTPPVHAADVGGAGSPLPRMLEDHDVAVRVIDPAATEGPSTVEAYAAQYYEDGKELFPRFSFISCISVVEHIADAHLSNFLDALSLITAPGGVLFFTMDYWDRDPDEPDIAMYNWMRERIYTEKTWQGLCREMVRRRFKLFGMPDWTYHGPQVEGYTFASLVLQKEK